MHLDLRAHIAVEAAFATRQALEDELVVVLPF